MAAPPRQEVHPIRSRSVFDALWQSGVRGRSGPLTVTFLGGDTWSEPHVAYAIGRRVGGAVVRNRLRRRMRSIVTEWSSSLPAGAYLVSTGPGATRLPFNELRLAMARALQTATGSRVGDRDREYQGIP